MSDTTPPSVYEITYLGSTELHDVYHVAIYPGLVGNLEAQHQYKQQVVEALTQAKNNQRNVWVVVDLGHLTTGQFINLSYRIGLPFMRESMTVKAYGMGYLVVHDTATKSLDWLMRHTFRMEMVANRKAGLPPGFVGRD
ncbi:MAG: hypothetical protein JOZ51_02895 [Chloroflexi bacterium]|nr:hypothetical protein [Chloroflexota bacterium]